MGKSISWILANLDTPLESQVKSKPENVYKLIYNLADNISYFRQGAVFLFILLTILNVQPGSILITGVLHHGFKITGRKIRRFWRRTWQFMKWHKSIHTKQPTKKPQKNKRPRFFSINIIQIHSTSNKNSNIIQQSPIQIRPPNAFLAGFEAPLGPLRLVSFALWAAAFGSHNQVDRKTMGGKLP